MKKIFNFIFTVFLTFGFFSSVFTIAPVVAPHDCTAAKCVGGGGAWSTSPDSCSTQGTTDMPTEAGTCTYSSTTTSTTCANGPISATCNCGGTSYSNTGYCCSNVYQSSACGTATTSPSSTPSCQVNVLTSSCVCGPSGTTYTASGYCCSSTYAANGYWSSSPCTTSTETCSSSQFSGCHTSAACTGATGKWCPSSNSYGGDCYSSGTTCPATATYSPPPASTCSSTNPWNCYTQADCTDPAKGKGVWCKSSNSYGGNCNTAPYTCPTCSSSQKWACYDQTSCSGASGQWCTSTAGGSPLCSDSCPTYSPGASPTYSPGTYTPAPTYTPSTCSSSNIWNCYDKTSCETAGGQWTQSASTAASTSGWCGDKCSSTKVWSCSDQTSCTGANGVWCKSSSSYGGNCNSAGTSCPTCSSSQTWNCYDEASCKSAAGNWCGNYCQSSACPTCSKDQYWNCNTETSCKGVAANWCTPQYGGSGYCQSSSCPTYTCSKTETWNCKTESECKTAGGYWGVPPAGGGGYCSSTPQDEASCKAASQYWCSSQYTSPSAYSLSGWCQSSSCPTYTCSSSEAWNCRTESDCKTKASGNWCGSYCQTSSCPTCSKDQYWNCNTETSCKGVAANWCTPQYGGSGYCQSSSCPTYTCSKTETWNCYKEADCKTAGGYWYNNYCSSSPPPQCSTSQYWNCFDKTSCSGAGAEWCESQYTTYSSSVGPSGSSPPPLSGWCGQKGTCPKVCPAVSQPKCSLDQTLDTKYDTNGCVISYECRKLSLCAASFDPVCGSDGKTYSNECEAKSAGATPVKYKGSCAVTNICDKKLFDPMQACRDQGKSYTFESDKNGCPIAGTTKCTEFQHRCPVAFVGLEEEKRMCEKAGGTYKPDTDPFGCTHGRCDGATKIVCPPQPTEDVRKSMEATCIKYGGTFSTKTESGCTFPDCMFPSDNLDLDNPFGRLTCPTNIDLERQTRPCEALNQNTGNRFIAGNRYVGGCQLVECVRDEEKCILDPTLEQSIANTCAEQKKDVVNKFDSKGCTYSICGDISECDKEAPKTVVDKCEAKGGEFKVEKDDVSGCVKFAHCIEPGLRPEDVVVEPVRTIPDTIILLDLVLKLDTLKITLDKLALKAQDLAAYYQAAGNTGEQDKFERVADLLSTAKDKIDEVKDKIREKLDTITIAELTEIKTDLVVLKDSLLREVLYLLLGKKTDSSDLTTLKDCGSDPACFDSRYRNCAPTTFTPPVPSGSSPTVKIEGLVDGKCSMTASMAVEGTAYDMKCSIADYGLGIHDPEDLIQHCTGNMADLIKSGYFGSTSAESQAPAEIQTTSPQPTQPTSQTAASSPAATASPASARITGQIIAGGTASANTNSVLSISRLSHDSSGVGEYKISVADKDGVNFVAIKKSGGIAVGSGEAGGCSTGFNLQDTFVLSPPDFPLTASVRDCTNPLSTYNIQIKMPPL